MSQSKGLFEYNDYRAYLESRLPVKGEGRGARGRLATALRVQSAFVSRVLKGDAEFSLEHGIGINDFLGHSESEGHYFLLLLELARAGTRELKAYFLKQIQAIRETHRDVSDRLKLKEGISDSDQALYYSSWHFAAVHVALLVPALQTPQAVAQHLGLSLKKTSETLEFLAKIGLAQREHDHFKATETWIHLPGSSPHIGRHHANWRIRAIQKFEDRTPDDLFFSGPICISREDAGVIRERLIQLMKELEPLIKKSPEETLFCLNFDYFKV